MICPNEGARVARKEDDRERAEDGVDGAPFEPELAQVRPGEQRVWGLEKLSAPCDACDSAPARPRWFAAELGRCVSLVQSSRLS